MQTAPLSNKRGRFLYSDLSDVCPASGQDLLFKGWNSSQQRDTPEAPLLEDIRGEHLGDKLASDVPLIPIQTRASSRRVSALPSPAGARISTACPRARIEHCIVVVPCVIIVMYVYVYVLVIYCFWFFCNGVLVPDTFRRVVLQRTR